MTGWLFSGLLADVLPWLIGVLAAVGGLWGYGRHKTKQGAQARDQKARDQDYEKADAIRDRVDRHLDERVRDLDDAGYRD